jgi:hypothetical protein
MTPTVFRPLEVCGTSRKKRQRRASTPGKLGRVLTAFTPAYRLPSCGKKVRSNLGPNVAELGPKPCTMTQNKAGRTNKIDFLQLAWAQEVHL